jgi:hypothetical protein
MTARVLVVALLLAGCAGDGDPEPPTPLQREVRHLAERMEALHPDLFHDVSRETFRAEAEELADAVPELTRDEVVAGVLRLVALPGDLEGHTALYPFDPQHPRGLHVYPLRLYDFSDGLYAIAESGDTGVVGRRLTTIAGRPVAEVVELVRPLVPHDNESSRRWLLPEYVTTAEVLRGLGVASEGAVRFGFEGGREVRLEPVPAQDAAAVTGTALTPPPTAGDPVWLRNLEDDQWLTTLEGGRVVYLGYRLTTGDTFETAERLAELAARPSVRRVIVDVRLNHGGDNTTYGPLLEVLERPAISPKVVLLTGRQTFSAAGNFTGDIADRTRARIVGELAGGAPSTWGDSLPIDLPKLGLVARVATIYHEHGTPGSVRPDVEVEPTAADLLAGRDPVLARALTLP